jgi:hypothetical protein
MPQVQVFPCPRCGEFIATDASQCRFCSTPIDPQKAQEAAAAQVKDNERYMRSRYLRHMLTGAGLFLLGLFISILSIVKAYSSPSGGYYVVTWGFVIFGGGDFLYGLVGVIGLMRSKQS